MASILQFVFFRSQAQHQLCVSMKVIVEVIQQGSPRPVLKESQNATESSSALPLMQCLYRENQNASEMLNVASLIHWFCTKAHLSV